VKIPAALLSKRLADGLVPVYLLHGSELLLIEESVDCLRQAATALGYSERLSFTVENGFNWDDFLLESRSLSLFSSKRLLELRLPNGKPGISGAKTIREYANNLPPDTILVVVAATLEYRDLNAVWVKTIDQCGVLVEHREISAPQLPGWILQRLRQRKVSAQADVADFLAYSFEGNLLALAQQIDRLALQHQGSQLTLVQVQALVDANARFSIFSLADAALDADIMRCQRLLQGLQREGAEPILIQWVLAREIRALLIMRQQLDQGQVLASVLQKNRVWSIRKRRVGQALQRLHSPVLRMLLQRLARLDRILKGRWPLDAEEPARGTIWDELEYATLLVCGYSPNQEIKHDLAVSRVTN